MCISVCFFVAWDSFIAYVRGLSDTPTEDEKLKPTIVEPVKDDKNVLLLSHSSKVYRLALHGNTTQWA